MLTRLIGVDARGKSIYKNEVNMFYCLKPDSVNLNSFVPTLIVKSLSVAVIWTFSKNLIDILTLSIFVDVLSLSLI